MEVVQHLLEGKSNKMIAASLGVAERTIEFHLRNIYDKYQVRTRTELILKLGRSTGVPTGKNAQEPGISTVAEGGKPADNGETFTLPAWASSLKAAFLKIGKEIKMESSVNSTVRGETGPLTFYEAVRTCLTKYADFTGRASRSEFWWFALFVTLVTAALTYIHENVGAIFLIAVLLPFLAAGTRRLRDAGENIWWQLFLLVPVGGLVILGFMWARPSQDNA